MDFPIQTEKNNQNLIIIILNTSICIDFLLNENNGVIDRARNKNIYVSCYFKYFKK